MSGSFEACVCRSNTSGTSKLLNHRSNKSQRVEISTRCGGGALASATRRSVLARRAHELLDVVGREGLAVGLVELALELHPVQPEGVEEALQDVHAHEHPDRDAEPAAEHDVEHEAVGREGHLEAHRERLLEEDKRELLVRQRQRPDTEVGRRVGDGAEHELDGLDDLVDEDLAELELLAVPVPVPGVRGLLVDEDVVSLLGLLRLHLVLEEQDERLGEKHERHRHHGVVHQALRELHGPVPERELVFLVHRHADERVDDARAALDRVHPLVEDHHVHPAEEAEHE
eukprot:CAMPEP_0179290446 /NCGR_PEP_ID=MMETSP0797-20121207/41820_1 /TAXON_ID=47934 /ORGANISM="Dinophysis acuminata, Strain DAEP01" /LENGTH=285 /DNA_ID=CAMNT_0020999479 /DNA_START=88 /DNA_END=943 /DNA_ORIENTATION=-